MISWKSESFRTKILRPHLVFSGMTPSRGAGSDQESRGSRVEVSTGMVVSLVVNPDRRCFDGLFWNMVDRVVPLADPQANYLASQAEIDTAIRAVLEGSTYILGDHVDRFEKDLAAYVGVAHGVGVNNGTDALHLAIRSLGIGVGDEVVTVSHTAVATVAAIRMSGATPVLADVDLTTYTIDPEAVRALIGPRTKAVIAVHLYGSPAEMEPLMSLCREHGIRLIEDCAQAHGARYQGHMVGSMGDLSTFSFYPTKNLGAIGDGGMVLCNDDGIAKRLRLLRQYGWDTPQHSLIEGWNSRLDPLQAAILGVKLKHLPRNTARRRSIAEAYGVGLKGTPLRLPHERADTEHVHHLYVVRTDDETTRDGLREHLASAGVASGIHYALPVHLQEAYAGWVRTGSLRHTETVARTVLSLPMYPELSDPDQQRVIKAIHSFFAHRP